jgi:translocator protein
MARSLWREGFVHLFYMATIPLSDQGDQKQGPLPTRIERLFKPLSRRPFNRYGPRPQFFELPRLFAPIRVAIMVAFTLAIGFWSSLLMGDALVQWYPALNKPSFQPAMWVFPVVWTMLYTMMGIAAGLVWSRAPGRQVAWALAGFGLQLAANVGWTALFFGYRSPALALLDNFVLLALVLWCMVVFHRIHRVAGWLFIPYALWVAFAVVLNACIVVLN